VTNWKKVDENGNEWEPQYIDVLDHGFVGLIDFMGDDSAIVNAARVSYGKGTTATRSDEGLIRYLMRHYHTTPTEMCEIKLHVKAPIFVFRQWHRHRTACLAGDVIVTFDEPTRLRDGKRKASHRTMKELYDRFQPTENTTRPERQKNPYHKRDRVQSMNLRSCNEDEMTPRVTNIVDIWESGIKPIIRVEFSNGGILRATKDHMCLTQNGWLRLEDAPFTRLLDFLP